MRVTPIRPQCPLGTPTWRHVIQTVSVAAVAYSLAAVSGCYSPAELRDRADHDALALVDARRERLFGELSPFALPAATQRFGRWNEEGAPPAVATIRERYLSGEIGAVGPLDVIDALAIAEADSEQVQQQKESLYLAALELTEEQWRFGYRYTADGDASIGGDVGGTSANAGGGFGGTITRVLGSGAVVLANIGSDLFRFVSTGDGWDAATNVGVSLTQPLLRGSGRLITLEPLRQTERNLVYTVRDYERFRRTYAVDVTERVYRVLQSLDQLKNERLNFDNLVALSKRNDALAEAGRLSKVQSDQAGQDELRSKNRLVTLEGNVERQLDAFKVFLGLPVGVELSFEPGLLLTVSSDESFLDGMDEDVVVEFAIEKRLDVMTQFDRVQDLVRREAITRDTLRAGLGLSVGANSTSVDGRPASHRLDDTNWSAALDLDLPVDLLPARNAWRRAEINLVDRRRSYNRFLDNVAVTVRDALRRARNSFESLEIQRGAVILAERRVLGADLSQQAGTATTRDVLESQEALRQARDSETSAKIDFALSLLDLWLELEILRVDEMGVHVDEALVAELRERLQAP